MDETAVPLVDVQQPLSSPNIQNGVENETPPGDEQLAAPTVEKWTRTAHPRGRQAKDPLAHNVRFPCSSVESMGAQLRDYIANPTGPAEHTTLEFVFSTSAAFMVLSKDPQGAKEAFKAKPVHYQTLNRTAISVIDALSQTDYQEQLKKQKAIAKAIVNAAQQVDGYRYSFHNNWISKEDEACRFSYYCNDSTLNKGRAANEGAGMAGKKKVKPVYACNGVLHIKFSVTKQNLEVLYKHIPVHKTYEERAPPPRRDSKRRRFYELFAPEKLPKPGERKGKSTGPKEPKKLRPRKKRRATEPVPGAGDGEVTAAGDDSLARLMDFLGSAEKEGEQSADVNGEPQSASAYEPPVFPAEKVEALKKSKPRSKAPRRASSTPRQGRARPSNIPGTMSGYIGGDFDIQWAYEKDKPAQKQPSPTEPLQGIAAAAVVESNQPPAPAEPKSELDLLKEKLLEAEQRIQRLEAEKQRPMGPPGWPPPAPPAPPQSYGYPYAGGHYPPNSQQQYQYPPPQQHQQNQPPTQGHNLTPYRVNQGVKDGGQVRQPRPPTQGVKLNW